MRENQGRALNYSGGSPRPPRASVVEWLGAIVCFGFAGVFITFIVWAGIEMLGDARGSSLGRLFMQMLSIAMCGGFPATFAIYLGVRLLRARRKEWWDSARVRRRLCHSCGYDLRGGSEICPECGTPVPEALEKIAARLERMYSPEPPSAEQPHSEES